LVAVGGLRRGWLEATVGRSGVSKWERKVLHTAASLGCVLNLLTKFMFFFTSSKKIYVFFRISIIVEQSTARERV
jgi:hypothetical protein